MSHSLLLVLLAPAFGQQPPPPAQAAAQAEKVLGWRTAYDGCGASLFESIEKAKSLGIEALAACSGQRVSPGSSRTFGPGLPDSELSAIKERLRSSGVGLAAYFVPPKAVVSKQLLGFLQGLGIAIMAAAGAPSDAMTELCKAHSVTCVAAVDVAAWRQANPKQIQVVSVKDAGIGPLTDFMNEAYRLELQPLWILRGSLDLYAAAAYPIARYHAEFASRTPGVRRAGGISDEERALIGKAIPRTAPAKPKKPRRLLVIDLNVGRRGHPSIPHANLAIQTMGKQTGAFEAVLSNDLTMLKAENLRKFDAVYLNNTIGDLFHTPELRDSFAGFLAGGGGLIAHHAVTVTATEWPEFGEMIGARGASHRMADEQVAVRIEDPASPLLKAFAGANFEYKDEIFRFQPPYARDRVRVLLSIDLAKTDMEQGRCYGKCTRDDNDYPLAWIKQYGKGRVFYTTFGHNPFVFWDAKMLEMYLAAIQYALGDLEADSAPRKSGTE